MVAIVEFLLHILHVLHNNYAYIIDYASLLISLLTLITALRFKHRIRIELDKKDLLNDKKRLQKEFDGYVGSLLDGIYTVDFLQKIDLDLSDLPTLYKCLPIKLRLYIRWTRFYLSHFCIAEAPHGNEKYRHGLCKKIRHILVSIRKEG